MIQPPTVSFDLPDLPPDLPASGPDQVARLVRASRLLAELKGLLRTLPNPDLLLQTVLLQEAQASSEVENIVTTQDELYSAMATQSAFESLSVDQKEAVRYRQAVRIGLTDLRHERGISTRALTRIMQEIKGTSQGIRSLPASIQNLNTGEQIYTPPSGRDSILRRMSALEQYVNGEHDIDPLIQLAFVHYQFEAIHPFADGNGRTGRILNVLFLVHKGLLDQPLLYLSSYINRNRSEYYSRLRGVTESGAWTEWIDFMLECVAETAASTIKTVQDINQLRVEWEALIATEISRAPVREFVDLMLSYPYLKIAMLEEAGVAKRQTASRYLHALVDAGILRADVRGRETYFVNERLVAILGSS